MKLHLSRPVQLAGLLCSLILGGCGGGSSTTSSINGNPAPTDNIVVPSGTAVSIPGTVTTPLTLLSSMSWAASAPSGQPPLTLGNSNCATAAKTNTPNAGTVSAGNTSTGKSTWTCVVNVAAPQVTATTTYTLTLTSTDDHGNVQTSTQNLQVLPGQGGSSASNTGQGAAGTDFTVVSGSQASLQCANPSGTSVRWLQTSGGPSVVLSAPTSSATGFTAPAVTQNTPIVFTCLVTDASNNVSSSNVTATVLAPANTALSVQVGGATTVSPGSSVALSGTATWANSTGSVSSGPAIQYQWSVPATAPAGIQFLSPNNASTVVSIPSSITGTTTIPVSLQAVSGNYSSVATVNLTVNPLGNLALTLSPPAQSIQPGAVGTVSASVTTLGAYTNLFYQWSQLSGPTVALGGANTKSVSFVAPSNLTCQGFVRLKVAVGYQAITTENPGVTSAEAIIGITPATSTSSTSTTTAAAVPACV